VLLFSSLVTAVYVWRFIQLVWFTPPPEKPVIEGEAPWSMRIPALVLAAACLVFGTTSLSVDLARQAAEAILR
jgi:multicomponent Na+:H+ antiporter subunit D